MTYPEAEQIAALVDDATTILIVQADNPDADSLGSALALENIMNDLGKIPILYCGVDIPDYLHYLPGWDRVSSELPVDFDLSIIVDASTYTLFEKLSLQGGIQTLVRRPSIVLDHHRNVQSPLDFASIMICDDQVASAGELIYHIAGNCNWPIEIAGGEMIMASILGDTQGLTNDLARATTYRVMAELIDKGVERPRLEEARREVGKMVQEIYRYKAILLGRTEFAHDGCIAHVTITQDEISRYSQLYNPGPLVQPDMMQVRGVHLSIVFKSYDDGKVTASIRAGSGYGIAGDLATFMGGGGHAYAAGFKITNGKSFEAIRQECLQEASRLLGNLTTPEDITTRAYSV